MKEVKFFEVRDVMTFIPIMAIKTIREDDLNDGENFLLGRSGWTHGEVMVVKLGGPAAKYCSSDWNTTTMKTIHSYLQKEWFKLESGSVLDVEFILGKTTTPKVSERFD